GWVAFESRPTPGLPPGDPGGACGIWLLDRLHPDDLPTLVSVADSGAPAIRDATDPKISADGRFVTFTSRATNLAPGLPANVAQIFLRDLVTRRTEVVSIDNAGDPGDDDSRFAALSGDGLQVAFTSAAGNLDPTPNDCPCKDPTLQFNADCLFPSTHCHDVFVRDRMKRTTLRLSQAPDGTGGDHPSGLPAMSTDGRFVAFATFASNLI